MYSAILGDVQAALDVLDEALAHVQLDSLPAGDRRYLELASLYAGPLGMPERAQELLSEYEREVDPVLQASQPERLGVAGEIALAEGDPREAVGRFQAWDAEIGNPIVALPGLARAFDASGEVDSALAVYERYLTTPHLNRIQYDPWHLASTHKRLGELYEARGAREKAVEHYNEFVELWRDADPVLQPQVRDVRERIVRLVGEGR